MSDLMVGRTKVPLEAIVKPQTSISTIKENESLGIINNNLYCVNYKLFPTKFLNNFLFQQN